MEEKERGHLMPCYDLAVVGAGPAGSLTAALAARAGLSVILLEKSRLPREKTCGGLISARCLALLPRDLPWPGLAYTPVHAVRVKKGQDEYTYTAEEELGRVVRRAEFDLLLARYAKGCGAELQEGRPLIGLERCAGAVRGGAYCLVCGGAGSNPLHARCVAGADGAGGRLARLGGLRSRAAPRPLALGCAAVFDGTGDEEDEERGTVTFYPLPLRGGLGWSFPGPGLINRGVGGLAGPARLKREFRRLFAGVPENRLRFWPLPFTGPLRRASRENLLLVGDAAGLVEPFSGEGLHRAVESAVLAAAAVCTSFKEKRPAGEIYARLFRARFRNTFLPSLPGAAALHVRALITPGTLPREIAAIMTGRTRSGAADPRDIPGTRLLKE